MSTADAARTASTKPVAATTGVGGADADRPPEGVLAAISPELIRTQFAARPKGLPPSVAALLGEPEVYKIGPGDVIGITVFDHPEIISSAVPATTVADPASVSPAPGFIVSNTGQLSFPYAGTLRVAGMSVQELEDTITKRLARVFKEPQVNVRIQAFRSKRAYVEGEVRLPGLQVFTDIPMTLPEAISRAGGVLPTTGDRSFVTLTRSGATTAIDLMGMAEVGVDPSRIPLHNGDMITVRSREDRKVTVMGEVLRPQAMPMRNGRLSLNDALGEAGGVDLGTANPAQIYVVRNRVEGGQSIFHLDASNATALAMADGFALEPKDVVFVDPVPLVRWSRVVNLLLPSAQGANLIRATYK
ncbi:polysaccharide biosynthesis/export family protein [Variovorax sp. PAMC 28711]|uniref:polysaccharide biosynthesis/export family protein n=1 Tax=Variovorax sp. PAMC 28711 TaxID=1795631 RepID=UPI0009EC3602|nr:polysaccharide biosynthesis/export family protein [Variovorax sp. PAMC 28711]